MAKLLIATPVVLALVAAVLVVSAPRADAAAPDWMQPAIKDGRTSIQTNMDTARQGSPVVFTAARCRGDGAFLLFYEHRWLWITPVEFAVEVPADWMSETAPHSFAGGVADALAIDYGADLSGYFADHSEIRCPEQPIGAAHWTVRGSEHRPHDLRPGIWAGAPGDRVGRRVSDDGQWSSVSSTT